MEAAAGKLTVRATSQSSKLQTHRRLHKSFWKYPVLSTSFTFSISATGKTKIDKTVTRSRKCRSGIQVFLVFSQSVAPRK